MPVYLLPDDASPLGVSAIIGFGVGGQYGNSGDLVMSEHHEHTSVISEHAVEVGANVTDHIRELPPEFGLVVWVTDTPITTDELMGRGDDTVVEYNFPPYKLPIEATPGSLFRLAGAAAGAAIDFLTGGGPAGPQKVNVLTFGPVFNRAKELQEQLVTLKKAGTTFQIVTSTITYYNMVIESITMPRDEPGGAEFTIQFKTLNLVTTANVAAPKPKEPRGAPKTNAGAQATKPITAKDAASLAVKAAKALGVLQ